MLYVLPFVYDYEIEQFRRIDSWQGARYFRIAGGLDFQCFSGMVAKVDSQRVPRIKREHRILAKDFQAVGDAIFPDLELDVLG